MPSKGGRVTPSRCMGGSREAWYQYFRQWMCPNYRTRPQGVGARILTLTNCHGGSVIFDLVRLNWELPSEVFDYMTSPYAMHFTWSPNDALWFTDCCPGQALMMLQSGFLDAQEIFGRLAPQLLRQAYKAGHLPPSRPGLKRAYFTLFAWMEAMNFSPYARRYYSNMFMGQLFNDVIDPSVGQPFNPLQPGENRLGAVLEYIQRDGEVWHLLLQLAAMHPDLPAPGWDPSGTVYLDQMFRMVMMAVAQSPEQAKVRWNSDNYEPNEEMVRRTVTRADYEEATFKLAQQLIVDFQTERIQHETTIERRATLMGGMDPVLG